MGFIAAGRNRKVYSLGPDLIVKMQEPGGGTEVCGLGMCIYGMRDARLMGRRADRSDT